jgi:tetratricopeptide (TPR) repeat protein
MLHQKSIKGISIIAIAITSFTQIVTASLPAIGQQNIPNPLQTAKPDPLLPKSAKLTPSESQKLKTALDKLYWQANNEYKAGNKTVAFDIWFREIRLRRNSGNREEIAALNRVGQVAWQDNQKQQLTFIVERLNTIEKQVQKQKPVDFSLVRSLAIAYQNLRVYNSATPLYQQLLTRAKTDKDTQTQQKLLENLGELHLAWLDYPKAAAAYEELLNVSLVNGDYLNQVIYIKRLGEIYDKAKQPQNALRNKIKLLANYQASKEVAKLPSLYLAIANDYQAINRLNEASQYYQKAYETAWASQQFDYASDSLEKLGFLYRDRNKPEVSLRIYQALLKVNQRTYSYYDLMNTYDRIGEIYLQQKNYPQALSAFEKALEIAKSLNYQQDYFIERIRRASQPGA